MNQEPYSKPHHDDDIRWVELFYLSGAVVYETEIKPEPVTMSIEEFMDYVEEDLRKKGVAFVSWRVDLY